MKQNFMLLTHLENKALTFFFFCFEQKAVEVMCIVPKRCNDMMNVGRLQGFDVSWLEFCLEILSGSLEINH